MPDKIIVLQVELDELRRRKSDIDVARHERKAAAVNALVNSDVVAAVNANQPYQDVLLDVKRLIWNTL